MASVRYCPACDAPRGPEQQEAGRCAVCGTPLLDEKGAEPAKIRPFPALPERPFPAEPPRAPVAPEPPREPEPERPAPEPPPASESARRPAESARQRPAGGDRETIDYATLVADVAAKVAAGHEVFGLVGHSGSGKSHFLKALTYLLYRHGVVGQKATVEFHRAEVPGHTGAFVSDYAFNGPAGERWMLLDAGGELYASLRKNDWQTYERVSVGLTEWLRNCHGLFCFLHLQPGHFGAQPLPVDPTAGGDPAWLRRREEEEEEKGREARLELESFKHFLLFLRAIRHKGSVQPVVERCRKVGDLEEALRTYDDSTPLLDVPVMFFFTQADAYRRDGFEIRPGVHLHPRQTELPAAFTARYLPSLFGAVASQARYFKFDFLQSYEDHPTERKDQDGNPIFETYFHASDDPGLLLSAGLGSGVEFVLRNRPGARRGRWRLPELDGRRALLLHRLLHPKAWRGVPRNLLGGWLPGSRTAPPKEASADGGRSAKEAP